MSAGTKGDGRASVGVLGGTFNPPHVGHLSVARYARDQLGLAEVLLVPVHTPPHKPSEGDPGPEHRLAMVRLIAAEAPWLKVSDVEVQRGGSSYTVDTLRELHARAPETELTLIVGGDMARTLPAWRDPEEILRLARVAVAEREGSARNEIERALAPLTGCLPVNADLDPAEERDCRRIVFLDMPEVPVSSTTVRDAVAAGRPLDGLVTDPVADYTRRHRLYAAARRQEASR